MVKLSNRAVVVVLLFVLVLFLGLLWIERDPVSGYMWGASGHYLQLNGEEYQHVHREYINSGVKQDVPTCQRDKDKGSTPYCADNTLLVMVLTSYGNKARRNAIRQTWRNSYQEKGKQFIVKFVIGTLQLNPLQTKQLMTENDLHRDLVLLDTHFDRYNNLTGKVLQMLIWADQHIYYSYLLKIDDDMFALLDVIEKELKQRKSTNKLYWGFFASDHEPIKSGIWEEHNWFLCDKYLPYALGGGYVLSADVVHKIVAISDGLTLYNSEDVSVGTWTSPLDIERKHDARFQVDGSRMHACDNRCIAVHKQGVGDIWKKHNNLISKGVLCDEETRKETYQCYNWKNTPTKCCSALPCN